jgi:hypothetical protein
MLHTSIHQQAQGQHRVRQAAAWIATAALANGLAWVIGHLAHANYVLGTPLGDRHISLGVAVVATAAAGIAGWGLLVLFERRTSRPRTVWTAVALAVLLSSIVPIFVLPAATPTRAALTGLHCLAAAILIPGLRCIR